MPMAAPARSSASATPSPSLSPKRERNFSAGVNGGRGGAEKGLSVGYTGGTHVRQGAHLGQQRKVAAEHGTLRARSIKSSGVDAAVVQQFGGGRIEVQIGQRWAHFRHEVVEGQ